MGHIQELGKGYDESQSHPYHSFEKSDPSSGVGCAYFLDESIVDDENNSDLAAIMNVYYRSTDTLELQQSWWSFVTNAGWNCKSMKASSSTHGRRLILPRTLQPVQVATASLSAPVQPLA